MVKFKLQYHRVFIALSFALCSSAFAQIELINQDQIFTAQDNFKLSSAGSLRLQALNFDQYQPSNADQKYRRNGYSATSRIYLNSDYKINDDLHLITGYQNFINPAKILDWDGHYQNNDERLTTEQAYAGISSHHYGSLKYGKIYSLYYDVVGAKTDLWDYSTLAQPQTWSPFAYFDGTQAASKTLRYEKKTKNIDFYAAYLFEDHTSLNQLRYQRKSGQEAAVDIHLNKNLNWAISWKHNKAQLQSDHATSELSQDMLASALFYFDGTWMLSTGAGWYKNLLPNFDALNQTSTQSVESLLDTEAYGLEYYAGYHVELDHHGMKYIQPYLMGNYLKYRSGYDFSRRDHGIGVAIRFNHGFGFDYERLYTQDSSHTPDMHLFRLRYEW